MTDFAFPFEQEELDSLDSLVERYATLPGYFSTDHQRILRMIVSGGIFSLMSQTPDLKSPQVPPVFQSCRVTPSEEEAIKTTKETNGLSQEQTLRCIVVDGLAYVEKALIDFRTAKISLPSKPGLGSN